MPPAPVLISISALDIRRAESCVLRRSQIPPSQCPVAPPVHGSFRSGPDQVHTVRSHPPSQSVSHPQSAQVRAKPLCPKVQWNHGLRLTSMEVRYRQPEARYQLLDSGVTQRLVPASPGMDARLALFLTLSALRNVTRLCLANVASRNGLQRRPAGWNAGRKSRRNSLQFELTFASLAQVFGKF